MTDTKPTVSFDDIIQQGRRKKRAEQLAQDILGKRRSSAPPNPSKALGGSLASRVGVSKRNSSLPRTNSARQPRELTSSIKQPTRSRPSRLQSSETLTISRNNGRNVDEVNGGDGVYIKGAARTIYTVVASNFAVGTTAADIESVMESVGGSMSRCTLVASNPTVIAEMDFQEKAGADKVVDTFNGKKADGRVLYVYMKSTSGANSTLPNDNRNSKLLANDEVVMEIDENAESRETQDRLREQRRGRDEGAVFPTGPRYDQARNDDRYGRGPRQSYPDGNYGSGGRGGYGGSRRYYEDTRRFTGGQNWRA